MDDSWFVLSYVLLWIVTVATMLMLIAVLRQIGILHVRLGPTGALEVADGPPLGADLADIAEELTLAGAPVSSVAGAGLRLLVITSRDCSLCDVLAPSVRTWMRRHDVKVLVAMAPGDGDDLAYAQKHRYPADAVFRIAASESAIGHVGTPFGIVVDESWTLMSKGVVNNAEHLESLLLRASEGGDLHEHPIELVSSNGARLA